MFEYMYCGMPDQPERPTRRQRPTEEEEEEGEWIAIASGLEMGNEQDVGDLKSELFVEWLNGELGANEVRNSLSIFTEIFFLTASLERLRIHKKRSKSVDSSSRETLWLNQTCLSSMRTKR